MPHLPRSLAVALFLAAAPLDNASAAPAAAAAAPEIFVCRIDRTGHLFPEEIVFALDLEAGTGMVVDGLILYYNHDRGLPAEITEATPRKTVFKWNMAMTNMSGQSAIMRFRAVLQRPSLRLLLTAQPSGFSDIFTGRGRCGTAEVEIEGF